MELITIILPAMLGFIAAYSAEPVKNWATYRHKKKKLKTALYKEVLFILNGLNSYLYAVDSYEFDVKMSNFLPEAFIVYEHAKTDPVLFHELKESLFIDEFYRDIKMLKDKENSIRTEDFNKLAKLILRRNVLTIKKKRFDKKLVSKFEHKELFAKK